MNAGCDNGTNMALQKFKEAFGEDNVRLEEEGSGRVEYDVY